MKENISAVIRRLELESIEKMNWQFSKQLCISAALMLFLISLSTAPSVGAQSQLIVPERTWQGIPGLERTAQGRVFVSWFTGGAKEPAPENTVVLAYSDDAGKTFTEPKAMAAPSSGTRCFDPTLWIDPQGRLWYIFNRGNKTTATHDVHARICDDPEADPPVFGDEFRVGFDVPYAFRMNKVTVLSSGEWIMPVTFAQEPIHDWFAGPKQLQGVGISNDQGKTWTLHGAVKAPQWALECMITELRDRRLWMLIRTGSGVLWESYSADKGRTWSEGQATTIASPSSRFFIRRLASGNLLLVNHHKFKGRSHLTARLSKDEGATWNEGLLLDERGGVSYPDGVEDQGGLIWITYDRDRQVVGEILFATFREEDVLEGKDVSGKVRLKQKVSSLDDLKLIPKNWDAALAGDVVMKRLMKVTAPHVQGAHDAEFVCVGDSAYIVEHDNDVAPGHGAGAAMYCVLTAVNLKTLQVEKTHLLAKAGQAFANVTLPNAQIFVPRIIRKDEYTLRTYFCSQPAKEQAVTWYRDFDLRTQTFADSIHKAKLKTTAGTFDMEPRQFHAEAAAQGFTKPPVNHGLYIFDSFKTFDGRNYVALNNFPGKQNALAVLQNDFATFEVIGHYNEPQSQQLSESAVNRLPDSTWMAICRNDGGNYHFTTSKDGKRWTVGETKPFVPNGLNSKPTFDKFGSVYYLGWQENTRVYDCNRSVFNIDISRDGLKWQRKYRFESPHSFQYPTLHEHGGTIWLAVTQSDHQGSSDRIMFGKLETVGQFESQAGQTRIDWPAPPPQPVVMANPGAEFQDEARPGAMIIGMDRTPKGRLWGCWTGTGDKRDGYFLLATSDDDGTTWSKPRLAVGARTEPEQKLSGALVGNLWRDPKGRLWLFFDQQLGDPQKRITNWFIRCDDPDAALPKWSEPVQFAEGCTLNKPTVLTSGDWLLPVSDWQKKTARVFASTDEGASWKERGHLKFPDWQFDEHMMVELKDGRLWMLARTSGQPYETFSSDGGTTWSTPLQAATVQNVSARFFLRRLKSGRILLVKNGPPTERLAKRSHMSAYLSDDDGQTWKGGLLLDERSAVSYPDGFESPDGLIHILYDWNRHTDAEILLAKFREEDVLAGHVVSKGAKLLQLVNKAIGPKPENLYNGIELPDVWPPRFLDPDSSEPMEVPYLKQPPKTIPIDVGRQLFVDDFLIESTTLKRTFHTAKKFEGNPVFKAETKHELSGSILGEKGQEAVTYLGHGGVFFDPEVKQFKMFYTAGWRGPLALATSTDLKTWTRPNIGILEDNLLLAKGRDAGGDNSLWLDLASKDARLKFLTDRGREGHFLQTSADGRAWSEPTPTGKAADYCSIFHNPFRNVWCYSIKQGGKHGRNRWYHESRDFLAGADWSKSVFWANADRLDETDPQIGVPAQLYSLSAVAYESVMLGMFQIHLGPDNKICLEGKFPKITELKLGFSRDGFHWDRPDRHAFIAATRKEGDWDRGYVHATTGLCVVLDDQLVFPYCAYSGIAPSGHRGMYTGGSIGVATLRRDGFASMDAADKSATLITRPLRFSGKHLFVNVDAPQGELRAELLDSSGKVLVASKPITADSTKQRIEWLDQQDLAQWSGRPVRLRFQLSNGQLYSFWVTSDESGASNGYVGAGGPEFSGVRDVE